MKTLLLMRHSHAVSNNSAYSDHERPLTDEGRALATTTAKLFAEWPLDEISCSSAARTIETAELVTDEIDKSVSSQSTKELYLASPGSYATIAAKTASDTSQCVAIVGHNPGVASLICNWADDFLPVPPATVAVFQLAIDDWTQLSNSQQIAKQLVGFISNGVRVR